MSVYQFSGSFNNDKKVISEMFNEVSGLVNDVESRFEVIKSKWVDPEDVKGNQLKSEIDTFLSETKTELPKVETQIEDIFTQLDNALKRVNG